MRFPRSGGTLVHPTSFPGKYGIGDFGYEARTFINFLADTDQTIWQVLPLTPTGNTCTITQLRVITSGTSMC